MFYSKQGRVANPDGFDPDPDFTLEKQPGLTHLTLFLQHSISLTY